MPIGEGPEFRPRAVVELTTTAKVLCTCPREERIPLSKLDRQDPILGRYLAPPATPTANIVSPLRVQARREAAGIGFAVWAFAMILLIIALGDFLWAFPISVVLGYIANRIIWQSRKNSVMQNEAVLAEQARALQDVYNARRAAWERLSYCPTDRCVVDDATGESRPLHAAHELLILSPVGSQTTNAPA